MVMDHIILTLYTSLIVQSLRITDFIFASISHKVNMFSLKLEVKNICIIFIDLNPQGSLPTTSPMLYFKLPYIGHYSAITQNKRSTILLSAIAMTWISNWFSLPSKSVTYLVWKTLSLTDSVHVWFISLYVLAVMPVTSVKPAAIFPHMLESTKSVTGPLAFSGIWKILHIVALCAQQITSMF